MRFVEQEAILIVLERVFGDLDASEVNLRAERTSI